MYNGVPSVFGSDFFDSIFDDFNQLMKSPRFSFDDSFPPINLFMNSDNNACTFELALTGYKKDWLNIEIDGTKLTIEAVVPEETDEKDTKKYLKRRIQAKSFKKMYKIPEGYNTEEAEVTYEDGLLTIIIPIKEEKITSRKLEIK